MNIRQMMVPFAVAAMGLAGTAWAENHALLIGVSSYPTLDKSLHLSGPANDVQLMREVLKTRGFAEARIRVLADGVPAVAGEPTRAAILGELKGLADRAARGDFVYLQFGGHGSQQPTRAGKMPAEPDGLDEMFLPRDVGKWDGGAGSVQNALLDEELGKAITAIRARGAFVWAVFDNCHSGNVTRGGGGGDGLRERKVDPLRGLGIPAKAIDAAVSKAQADGVKTRGGASAGKGGALGDGESKEGLGGFVYFYAAQSSETAPEMNLPAGQPGRKPYGVFTYTLAEVMTANPGISYRQAGERVLQLYAAKNMRYPTPLFEGSGLDAPLFGQESGETIRQWKLVSKDGRLEIAAGALQQFGEGAIFAVYADATAKQPDTLGYLRASKVGVTASQLVPLEMNGKPALKPDALTRDAVVRMVDPALNLNLRVAMPAEKAAGNTAKVLEKLRTTPPEGLKVEWVAAGQPADLRLALADNKLWLLPVDGAWIKSGEATTPSIQLDKLGEELQQIIAGTLQKVARVSNLIRMSGAMQASGVGARVSVSMQVFSARTGKTQLVPPGTVPSLEAGDRVQLIIRNNHFKDVDVTVLGVDSLYGIGLLYPMAANEANRIGARSELKIPADGTEPIEIDGKTAGQESILVIAVEAEPQSPQVNLAFLAQEGISRERSARGATTIESLFADARDGGTRTRGVGRGAALEKTTIQLFNYRAVAK